MVSPVHAIMVTHWILQQPVAKKVFIQSKIILKKYFYFKLST